MNEYFDAWGGPIYPVHSGMLPTIPGTRSISQTAITPEMEEELRQRLAQVQRPSYTWKGNRMVPMSPQVAPIAGPLMPAVVESSRQRLTPLQQELANTNAALDASGGVSPYVPSQRVPTPGLRPPNPFEARMNQLVGGGEQDKALALLRAQAKQNVANRPPMPNPPQGGTGNGYAFGFPGGGLGQGALDQIARTQANDQRRFMPVSQRRQVDTPVGKPNILQQALAGQAPFGSAAEKSAHAAFGSDLDVSFRPDGMMVVTGPNTEAWRFADDLTALDRSADPVTQGTITPAQEEKARKAAFRRVKGKAKKGGVIMAGADENSSLAEIKNAEAEIEKRIANKRMGLPEDDGIGQGNQVADNPAKLDPSQAGIAAIQAAKQAKAKALGIPVKFVPWSNAEAAEAYATGRDTRTAELEQEREMAKQKLVTDANATLAKEEAKLRKKLSKNEQKAADSRSNAQIASAEKIAGMESDDRKRGFEAERDQKVVDAARDEWAASHGGRGPRTAQERAEVDMIVQDRKRQRDGLPLPAPPTPFPPPSINPVEAQRMLNEESADPNSQSNSLLSVLGVKNDASAPELAKALAKRMQSTSPLSTQNLLDLQQFVKSRDLANPDFYDPSMLNFGAGTGSILENVPFLPGVADPGVGMFMLDYLASREPEIIKDYGAGFNVLNQIRYDEARKRKMAEDAKKRVWVK